MASSKQLVQSSTVPETSATATESVLATFRGAETQVKTATAQQTAIELIEPTQNASPARALSERQAASSALTGDVIDDDADQFEAVPLTPPLHLCL
jgi:hypothetical protein